MNQGVKWILDFSIMVLCNFSSTYKKHWPCIVVVVKLRVNLVDADAGVSTVCGLL